MLHSTVPYLRFHRKIQDVAHPLEPDLQHARPSTEGAVCIKGSAMLTEPGKQANERRDYGNALDANKTQIIDRCEY